MRTIVHYVVGQTNASISKKSNPLSVPVSWSETTIFQKNLNNVAFSIKLIAFSLTYHELIYIHYRSQNKMHQKTASVIILDFLCQC